MNLLVRLKVTGKSRQRRHAATRLKIDDQSRVTLISATGAPPETLAMVDVESMRIQ